MRSSVSTLDYRNAEYATTQNSNTLDRAGVMRLLDELHEEVETRVGLIRAQSETLTRQIRSALQIELMKLPKKIRAMTVAQFVNEYGGNVENVIMENVKRVAENLKTPMTHKKTQSRLDSALKPRVFNPSAEIAAAAAPTPAPARAPASTSSVTSAASTSSTSPGIFGKATPAAAKTFSRKTTFGVAADNSSAPATDKKRKGTNWETTFQTPAKRLSPGSSGAPSSAMKTPAFDPRLPHTPRFPTRGESIMSANGSPLGVFDNAAVRVGRTTIVIEDEKGRAIALDSPTVGEKVKKNEINKDFARSKLQQVQSKVNALLAQLDDI